MDSQETVIELERKEITFPNGNRAQVVAAPAGTTASLILKALGIEQPKALLLIVGGAGDLDKALTPRLLQLSSRGIARAAVDTRALIMDGGTQAGVMAMMGQGVADRGRKSVLLGVAPAGKVTYPGGPAEGSIEGGAPLDPNHSHFVLVESDEWGGETKTMFELASALSNGIPIVAVLVSGGDVTRNEVLMNVRRGWPILVIEGTGRLADEVAKLWKEKPSFVENPVIAEIIADGNIQLFAADGEIEDLRQRILRQLQVDPTLKLAWERFALYEENAKRHQNNFGRLQRWVVILGVLSTLYVVTQAQLRKLGLPDHSWQNMTLHYTILIMPIAISVLVAAVNRFKPGNIWVLLRASAEGIKREIYRYRTRAETYKVQPTTQSSPEAELANKVEATSRQLMQTDVNLSALQPYDGPIPPRMYGAAGDDDGFSPLSPDRYLTIRLGDQLSYYSLKTTKLEKQLKALHWGIYLFGGVGTLLAAVGLELWVALATGLVGAFTTFLGYQQVENTLMKYNQAATNLANIQAWWTALSTEEKADQKNIDSLVGHTEEILASELTGWVQQMQDALSKLRAPAPSEGPEKDGSSQTAPAAQPAKPAN